MFIELAKLINQASLARLNLNIQPSSEGRISVIVTSASIVGGEAKDEKLRQSLTGELRLEGTVSELEDGFINHLSSFSDSYIEKSLVANTNEVIEQHSKHAPVQSTEKVIKDALTCTVQQELENEEQTNALDDWS